ncbi:hypothetical protein L313_2814 [Acinetobacter haemolyticus CIP 64.3 = MTCC 9819]|uniref:Uncharacterized protein n=1 Tax=Acinetobacter haemolyticus CIP 64.3 = MTCC 9819 TaxID=1217659 RepID=N9EZE1_ACIHA|nr:hypothetical protein [Acinetobacter haemolyticus]ENW15632.1 hypothetical protein F927_03372 [Acinetobacter haemolyticus CIP 64.3 = MTCC 9819]EPR90404.1 hypothetical protein L313_2814 [Acinetobacter haemolyticus CIP 64.3 = MTCC 9819]QXZ26456.1 hypothetical protein I6L22_15000 [Acinetobacter haemolyticus]SPT48645.1 Uncharacterised protein [Acinetobacter haemolyticus]SUU61760.1 Uncharacterised protein [Acinetobacter haemolyticus]
MRDEQVKKIENLAEEVTDDFIITTCKAINTTIHTKEGRGDKGFLYSISQKQSNILATLERVLAFKNGKIPPISATAATQEKYEQQLIEKAEKEAEKLKQRLS